MIKTLHISNYALIDELDIDFAPGFNIITGETGAGKSIILGALSLLLGGRADLKAIKRDENKSVIEAVFTLESDSTTAAMLAEMQLEPEVGNECILRREISPGGRTRAFVNDTPVGLQQLRAIATQLVDIHSQHENLLLAQPEFQLRIIDCMAANEALVKEYHKAYAAFRAALKEFTDTRDMLRRNRDDADFISFQYEQLRDINIQAGEQQQLEDERIMLETAGTRKERIDEALLPLADGDTNALSLIDSAVDALTELSASLEESMPGLDAAELVGRLDSVRIEVADIADSLREQLDNIDADPERLESISQRLAALYSLELKHHVESSDDLIAIRDQLGERLTTIENGNEMLAELERKAKRAKKTALEVATELSKRRSEAAPLFAATLRERAMPLGMPNLRCEVPVERDKLGPDGIDSLKFLFAFNKNQELMPVGNTASGGEVSRLMLSLKSIVAEKMNLPTVIFDEVDTGVSGEVATRMADMMAHMSRYMQVITITHLPGVAAMGSRHFKVYKEDGEVGTNTRICRLDEDKRPAEIALMISGNASDEAALANARALLARASETYKKLNDNGTK